MAHTASGALHFGIDEARLAAVRDYQESQLFNSAERAAFTFALAASSNPNMVNDAIFAELGRHRNGRLSLALERQHGDAYRRRAE